MGAGGDGAISWGWGSLEVFPEKGRERGQSGPLPWKVGKYPAQLQAQIDQCAGRPGGEPCNGNIVFQVASSLPGLQKASRGCLPSKSLAQTSTVLLGFSPSVSTCSSSSGHVNLQSDWEGMCCGGKDTELGAGIPGSSPPQPLTLRGGTPPL